MEMEFLYKDWFCNWFNDNVKRKTSNDKVCNPYTEGIVKLLKSQRGIHDFVQSYTYYVPALLLQGEHVLAKQLLACVYADACIFESSKSISYFKCYCKFIAKEFIKKAGNVPSVQLKDSKLNEIKAYLNNRQVWILDPKFANILKIIGGDKMPTFRDLFNIRIYSWGRPCFPLDDIKKIINLHEKINKNRVEKKDSFMINWVNNIRDSINVYVDINGRSIKLKEITAIELRRDNVDKQFHVFAIRHGVEPAIVHSPLANSSDQYKKMEVNNLDEVSIDHEYPLDSIVRCVMENESSILRSIADKYQSDPKYKYTESDLQDLDVESLKKEMTEIREATPYRLMERGLNSSKSNNTSFVRYKNMNGYRKFIVAENILDEKSGKICWVYFTDKEKTKRIEEQPKE